MELRFHKKFDKQYSKLNKKIQKKVDKTIENFMKNPFSKNLYNHPLKGLQKYKRSISVTGDLRIIFKEQDDYTLVFMLELGTHSQLY